jgi:hypothetical protein
VGAGLPHRATASGIEAGHRQCRARRAAGPRLPTNRVRLMRTTPESVPTTAHPGGGRREAAPRYGLRNRTAGNVNPRAGHGGLALRIDRIRRKTRTAVGVYRGKPAGSSPHSVHAGDSGSTELARATGIRAARERQAAPLRMIVDKQFTTHNSRLMSHDSRLAQTRASRHSLASRSKTRSSAISPLFIPVQESRPASR